MKVRSQKAPLLWQQSTLKATKPRAPPSLPGPALPLPSPCAACSHAWSALGRVNHCKNKEMKGSPIGELSAASSPYWGRRGGHSGRASRRASKTLLPSAGWEPRPTIPKRRRPHNLAPPEGPAEAGGGGQAIPPLASPRRHNPTKQKHKAWSFMTGP